MPLVQVARERDVVTVTFDHPERRNSLSRAMVASLLAVLGEAGTSGCRALILQAAEGSTVWSSGHDIDELPGAEEDPVAWVSPVEDLVTSIQRASFPVIAAVEGGAWGASCQLALACDVLIATRSASFTITPAKLGLPYHLSGIAQFLWAVPLNVAREMLLCAVPLSAEDAWRLGVVNHLVADGAELRTRAAEVAERVAGLAPLSLRAIKADIGALVDAQALSAATRERLMSLHRDAWTSRDLAEGLAAFRERRTPTFEGN